jgi:hypothetical protein
MICKFTLMTAGDPHVPVRPANGKETNSNLSAQQSTTSNPGPQRQTKLMAAPPRPEGRRNTQTLGRRGTDSNRQVAGEGNRSESDSLFVPLEEEDRSWDPTNYDEDENVLAWDTREPNVILPMLSYLRVLTVTGTIISSTRKRKSRKQANRRHPRPSTNTKIIAGESQPLISVFGGINLTQRTDSESSLVV